MTIFEAASILVGLSALFGYLNYRFIRLPHTIGMVVMAVAASLVLIAADYFSPEVQLADRAAGWLKSVDFQDTLLKGMLSFLLFAGAIHVDFSAFRERATTIAVMAVFSTLISTFLVGALIYLLLDLFGLQISFLWALVFGALISPTDPVAVLGLFKTIEVPPTLEATMAGESLFNDGVGVVVFTVFVGLAMATGSEGTDIGTGAVLALFLQEAGGGILLGLVAGWLAHWIFTTLDEHNLETLISLAVVMVTYALSIRLDMSGPIAMVVAGLVLGYRCSRPGDEALSADSRDYLGKFWSLIDELLNTVLFLLIGLEVLLVAQRVDHLPVALLAIPVVLFSRYISVVIPIKALASREAGVPGTIPVLTWGGLRGGIAVALALSLPENEHKAPILTVTYAVVLFSIVVQGLTIKPLVQKVVRPT